ncbi:MAG TPA: glutathione S-transferase N-terminal domain-containing protein [Polyangiaceae bacterium]|nr:glutathione S-transferase N-terminal domain-containing protein [Polyangiaceae bacterium]
MVSRTTDSPRPLENELSNPGAGPVLYGRSSSHFTRVVRIVAAELGVAHAFRVVPNLLSLDASEYGGNPALRVPSLHTEEGPWFGALNICRVLERRAASAKGGRSPGKIVWPEDLGRPVTTNAQELALQAMSSEVALIMARVAKADESAPHLVKQRETLERMLAWLEANVSEALAALPAERQLSFLEVTLFCLVQHLEFRDVLPVAPYRALGEFCRAFGERASAQATVFRFD